MTLSGVPTSKDMRQLGKKDYKVVCLRQPEELMKTKCDIIAQYCPLCVWSCFLK